tara:strand:+ start:45 stop:767 length:723 start_codon:yes stop_codon:yes gene_type:complete
MDFRRKYERTEDGNNGFEENHEAFGMVQFSRCSGSTKLFGSHLSSHPGYISLRIYPGVRRHSHSRDWYAAKSLKPYIEVMLSAAQFAELVTSMNVGSGVPCTINSILGERLDAVPDHIKAENAEILAGFKDKLQDLASVVTRSALEMEKIVNDKGNITKSKARGMLGIMRGVAMEVSSNIPYVLTAFQEAAGEVVTHSKAEVESFTNMILTRAGMEHMRLQKNGMLELAGDFDGDNEGEQ